MSSKPVNSWNTSLLVMPEVTFGTVPTPASTAAYAALALEIINANLGPAGELGLTRGKQDRNQGRGMQNGFVEGRVTPIEFNVVTSVKSRATADAAPLELALYKAAGMSGADTGSTYTVSLVGTPIDSGDFVSVSLRRQLGIGTAAAEAETLRGCVVRNLRWEGGDKEVMLTASGAGIGKYTFGAIDSITLADGSGTSLTITAEESYRLGLGYYLCESEIIAVTATTAGATSATIARAQLGTTGVAHSAKPLRPYLPSLAFTGSPISEANTTVSIDSIDDFRLLSWSVDFVTGMDLLDGETSSRYIQGPKSVRYDVRINVRLLLNGDQVSLLRKATARKLVDVNLQQGTGSGSIITIASSYCEVEPFVVPDTNNDVAVCDVTFRVRDDSSGNNALSIVMS